MGYKSRKFLLFVAVYFIMSVFFQFTKITSAEYIEFTKWLFGIYVFGNVGASGVNTLKNRGKKDGADN